MTGGHTRRFRRSAARASRRGVTCAVVSPQLLISGGFKQSAYTRWLAQKARTLHFERFQLSCGLRIVPSHGGADAGGTFLAAGGGPAGAQRHWPSPQQPIPQRDRTLASKGIDRLGDNVLAVGTKRGAQVRAAPRHVRDIHGTLAV